MSTQPAHTRVPRFELKDRLRLAREVAGLEQIDVAEALDMSRATVSNYERAVTTPGKLVINAWAVTCDVDVEWLKTGHDTEETPPGDDPKGQVGPGAGAGPRSPHSL
ncbi:helix-turn-helix domain-containing protein [Arthrobacter sp. Hz1]